MKQLLGEYNNGEGARQDERPFTAETQRAQTEASGRAPFKGGQALGAPGRAGLPNVQRLKIQLDGFLDVLHRLLHGVAFADATGKGWNEGCISAIFA